MRKVLVVSVHPDDETLGCGGTLCKHAALQDELYWLNFTDVYGECGYSKEFIENRKNQIKKIKAVYQIKELVNFGFPTLKLHSVDFAEIVGRITSVIKKIEPEIIYTVNRSDVHSDHRVAAQAMMSATKTFRHSSIKRILMYECISETEVVSSLPENIFLPNAYSDITPYMEKKLEIMQIYESEIYPYPFPRSVENIRALARVRGAAVNVKYAESFMILKDIF